MCTGLKLVVCEPGGWARNRLGYPKYWYAVVALFTMKVVEVMVYD